MKKILLLALIAAGVPGAAFAKDVKLPQDKPVIAMSLPDAWSPKDVEDGVEATSADGSTYIVFEVTDAKDLGTLVEESVKFLIKEGVTLDMATKKRGEGVINGMKSVNFDFAGKDKEGDTKVSLTVLLPNPEKAVLITYWGTAEGEKANAAALDGILKSLKPAS
jgi:hypothetical protein